MATNSVLPEGTRPEIDPIDQLIESGLTARDLIPHTLAGVEWLAEHANDSFRLCYFDSAGAVVVENVTAAILIKRGHGLGWTACVDHSGDHPFILFEEAMYHFRDGVHYYSSANSETDDYLPLCFPASEIEESERRHREKYSPEGIERARQQREKLREEAREHEECFAMAALDRAVAQAEELILARAMASRESITKEEANRQAWQEIRKSGKWNYHMITRELRQSHGSARNG